MADNNLTIHNHPYVETKVANDIEKGYWQASLFDSFTGSGHDRIIRQFHVSDLSPFVARLKGKSYGRGVRGNTNFADSLDTMDWYAQSIAVELDGNAMESEIQVYEKTKNINFEKEARENLIEWFTRHSDRMIIANLVNNFTNVVIPDAANAQGYKQYRQGDTIKSMCAKITADDICSVASIRRLIFCARNGIALDGSASNFTIKPTRVENKSMAGVMVRSLIYVLFLDGYQAMQLKNDPEWVQIQSVNHNQGWNSTLYTGYLGMIDNCCVVELPSWGFDQAGMLNTEIKDEDFFYYVNSQSKRVSLQDYVGNNTHTSIGFLCGAGACIYANSGTVTLRTKRTDMDRKIRIAGDKLLGVAKAVFDGIKTGNTNQTMLYDSKDFSVIGYITAKV